MTPEYLRQRALIMRERAREMNLSAHNKDLPEEIRYHFAVLVTDFQCLAHQFDKLATTKEKK